ncbi:hypothetical protein BG015_002810, partial [Linnemannia schmuckeri]
PSTLTFQSLETRTSPGRPRTFQSPLRTLRRLSLELRWPLLGLGTRKTETISLIF